MHGLQPVLEAALGEKMVLPERKLRSIEAFIEAFPGVERVIIDGTECPIARPQDLEAQKQNYSGKKRRHTRKHLAAVDQRKRVLVLSKAREGKLHDKKLHDEDDIAGSVPDEIPIEVDLGFLGLHKQYDNIRIPHKKPKGGQLTDSQKADNRALSRSRVVCENAFAGVKRYQAVSGVYRNRLEEFDDHLMLTAAELWNFYLMAAWEQPDQPRKWEPQPDFELFPNNSKEDILHLLISEEPETASIEISSNATAELNAAGELIGVEILNASHYIRDFILESVQGKLLNLVRNEM